MPIPRRHGLLVLALVFLSGCASSPYDFVAASAVVRVVDGYSYDGSRVRNGTGEITIELNTVGNSGRVLSHVVDQGKVYDVVFNEFGGDEPYKDGGINQEFYEHGDTGNGSGELPKFYAYVAAWGFGTVRLNDEPQRDPSTLRERWVAHLMVSKGHVRSQLNNGVYKSDGVTVFDPKAPDDGIVHREGAQAMLQLRTGSNDLYYHFVFNDVKIARR